MSIRTDKLLVTSDFYTVQGEGISSGIPAYFIRLGVCNLSCGMSRKWFNELVKMHKDLPEGQKMPDGTIFEGDLHATGKATWTCDSTSQWALRGEDKDFQYLIDRWKEQDVYEDIKMVLFISFGQVANLQLKDIRKPFITLESIGLTWSSKH